jgi:hypothetical protein
MMSNNVSVINLYTYHLVLFTCILWKYRILIIRYNPSDTKPRILYVYVCDTRFTVIGYTFDTSLAWNVGKPL